MKVLILSAEDWNKKGGSPLEVYQKMIQALTIGGLTGEHRFVTSKEKLLEDLCSFSPDLVFSGAHYTFEPDGTKNRIHQLLEEKKVPYVGSSADALEDVLHKEKAKALWQREGIPTPSFFVIAPEFNLNQKDFSGNSFENPSFPLLLKPSNEGGSRGIDENSVVYDADQLVQQAASLRKAGYQTLLAEKYLGRNIREMTVAVIGDGKHKLVMPSELIAGNGKKKPLILDQKTKDIKPPKEGEDDQRLVVPVPLAGGQLRARVIKLASEMYQACNLKDYARCDILTDETGENLFAIEINGQSVIEKYFANGPKGLGLDYCQTINAIFFASLQRQGLTAPSRMYQVLPTFITDLLSRTSNIKKVPPNLYLVSRKAEDNLIE